MAKDCRSSTILHELSSDASCLGRLSALYLDLDLDLDSKSWLPSLDDSIGSASGKANVLRPWNSVAAGANPTVVIMSLGAGWSRIAVLLFVIAGSLVGLGQRNP